MEVGEWMGRAGTLPFSLVNSSFFFFFFFSFLKRFIVQEHKVNK